MLQIDSGSTGLRTRVHGNQLMETTFSAIDAEVLDRLKLFDLSENEQQGVELVEGDVHIGVWKVGEV